MDKLTKEVVNLIKTTDESQIDRLIHEIVNSHFTDESQSQKVDYLTKSFDESLLDRWIHKPLKL